MLRYFIPRCLLSALSLYDQKLCHDFSGNGKRKFECIPGVCPYIRLHIMYTSCT